jgi:hypothetical protein
MRIFRAGLILLASSAFALLSGGAAHAQLGPTVLPCDGGSPVVTCNGDVSPGVSASGPTYTGLLP